MPEPYRASTGDDQRHPSNAPDAQRSAPAKGLAREHVSAIRALAGALIGTCDRVEAQRLMHQQLGLEYKGLPRPGTDDGHADVRARFEKLLHGHPPSPDSDAWLALDEMESILLRLLSKTGPTLSRWNWRLRQDFKRLATGDLYEAYINSKPPDPDDAMSSEDKRVEKVVADAAFLLQETQRLRIGRRRIEAVRSYFACVALVLTVSATVVLGVLWVLSGEAAVKAMVLVPLLGMFGSFFSLISRLFSIPIKGDLFDGSSALARRIMWWLTPFISATQGAIAAFVIYLILMAGVNSISDNLLPQFVTSADVAKQNARIEEMNKMQGAYVPLRRNFPAEPASPPDAAKLYVICFLAGFSERLVPDVLSQLADKAKARKSSEP